ncbi:MAG: hypothetical protein AAB221_08625, partial [Bacteroidota bacterium]
MIAARPKLFSSIAILALLVFIACKKSSDTTGGTITPTDPVAAALNLPSTPFNYANPTMPAYLNAPPIQGQINT